MFQPIIKHIERGNDLIIGGSKVAQISYSAPPKMSFTKARIRELAQKIITNYKGGKDLRYMISVDTPFGDRSGFIYSGNNDSHVSLPEDDSSGEWTTAPTFVIFIWENKKENTGGADDENNDCLYNCITKAITKFRLPKNYKTPESLKEFLRLKRDDKINIALIPTIEDLYKININVGGDYSFTSRNKYPPTVSLQLINGHYMTEVTETTTPSSLMRGISSQPTQLVLCDEHPEKVVLYDGIQVYELDYEEYFKEKRDKKENSYINGMKKEIQEKGIVESYNQFIQEVEEYKEISKGKNDLSKSGYKIANEAKKCIYYSLKAFKDPDPITDREQQWIFNSTKGALIFSTPCELSNAYAYDRNSAYPATMADPTFTFPVKEGQFGEMYDLPAILNYGIYRVEIRKSNNILIDRLFRFNETNYYTHFDIQTARDLNLSHNIILDGEANALLYTKGRANGMTYFKETINQLYNDRKKMNSKLSKKVANAIWGALCEKNTIKRTTRQPIHLNKNEKILEIIPIGEELKVTYMKDDVCYYRHNYARMGTFLLAKVRRDMTKTILPYNNDIVKFHTDGFISKIPINDIDKGNELGQWKEEKANQKCIIYHSCKVEWTDV